MKRFIFVAALLALGACETPPAPTPPIPPATQDTCSAAQYVGLVGQDATALERILLIGLVRVIRPNQPVTADLRPDRINFDINAENQITSIWCG